MGSVSGAIQLLVVGALFVALLAILLGSRLLWLRRRVTVAFEALDALLTRRHELIPGIVDSIRGARLRDRELIGRVTGLATRASSGTLPPEEQVVIEGELTRALALLLKEIEALAQLAVSPVMAHLHAALDDGEDRIAVARRRYNTAVARYNSSLRALSARLLPARLRLQPARRFSDPDD